MKIGVPKEIKNHEYRVGLIPSSVKELAHLGHAIFVESNAGTGIGFSDEDYRAAGAAVLPNAQSILDAAELIVKVKEPQPVECKRFTSKHTLFAYLHLAPDPEQAKLLLASGCTAIAYETVTDKQGRLPLLTPASEVAGRMAVQAGASCLEKSKGGRGILLGAVPGVEPAKVVVLGGGASGTNAISVALGMGAQVTVIERNLERLRQLQEMFGPRLITAPSMHETITRYVTEADLVIGTVLIPGSTAPKLVTDSMVKAMKPGSVIVDLSIDQGGCCETSQPTTHQDPTYVVHDVVHYCVTNMPGGVARTATFAINNATLPYVVRLAQMGVKNALLSDDCFLQGLNVCKGKITHAVVAEALGLPYALPKDVLS